MSKILTAIAAYNLTGGLTKASEKLNSENVTSACLSVTSTAGAGATGNSTLKLQASADGDAWFDVADATVTISSAEFNANTPKGFAISGLVYPFLRAQFVGNAAITAGVITVKAYLR